MELSLPVIVNSQKHNAVRITSLVVNALLLGDVNLVHVTIHSEDRSGLRMEASHHNRLMHALQSHSKKEKSSNTNVTGKIHENLAKSCDLWDKIFFLVRRREGESSCSLEILDGIADISVLWRLDCSS